MPDTFRTDDVLNSSVDKLWNAAISDTTKCTYKSALQCFLTFMTRYGVHFSASTLPQINEDTLIYFVTHCQTALKLKLSTIKLYITGIRYHYLCPGLKYPTLNSVKLSYILRGIKKKSHCNITTKRLPITFQF